MPQYLFPAVLAITFSFFINTASFSQAEVQAWGNITALRIDGQPFRFESSLRLVQNNWKRERATGRERNWTTYHRQGPTQIIHTRMDSLFFDEKVTDMEPGKVRVEVELDPHEDQAFDGAFFHIALPAHDFNEAQIQQIQPSKLNIVDQPAMPVGEHEVLRAIALGLQVQSGQKEITIRSAEPGLIIVKKDSDSGDLGLYFTLQAKGIKKEEKLTRRFDIAVKSNTESSVATLKLFPEYPGNTFIGLGGNFRLQNMKNDPQVIDYSLENLEVRMGRVELPWQYWHPSDSIDPLQAAREGNIHPRVKAAMEMAGRLYKMGMPVLLAAWFPPGWAAEGDVHRNPHHPDGTFGNPLRQDRMEKIYESITGYILFLKEAYGVEVAAFSFNEADLGINVRQTPEEHAAFIKGLGSYMKGKGLNTKLLLGDTSDANAFSFVDAAVDDPETWEYIWAVSFHSWRGWKKETLLEWFDAANRLHVPLIVGEGSIDAAAWRYPGIFQEQHYAMEEIKLYIRMLAICQPAAILQWQLTSDYSPLVGGGIYGNDSVSLQPTQRFWNLKQLSQTPRGLQIIPVTSDDDELFVTAMGDIGQNEYTFHIVNDGRERDVVLTGLPEKLDRLRLYLTDKSVGMQKGKLLKVKNGQIRFHLKGACFTSLMSE